MQRGSWTTEELDSAVNPAILAKALWASPLAAIPPSVLHELRQGILRLYNKDKLSSGHPAALLTVFNKKAWNDPVLAANASIIFFWASWLSSGADREMLQQAWLHSQVILQQGLPLRNPLVLLWRALGSFWMESRRPLLVA